MKRLASRDELDQHQNDCVCFFLYLENQLKSLSIIMKLLRFVFIYVFRHVPNVNRYVIYDD